MYVSCILSVLSVSRGQKRASDLLRLELQLEEPGSSGRVGNVLNPQAISLVPLMHFEGIKISMFSQKLKKKKCVYDFGPQRIQVKHNFYSHIPLCFPDFSFFLGAIPSLYIVAGQLLGQKQGQWTQRIKLTSCLPHQRRCRRQPPRLPVAKLQISLSRALGNLPEDSWKFGFLFTQKEIEVNMRNWRTKLPSHWDRWLQQMTSLSLQLG